MSRRVVWIAVVVVGLLAAYMLSGRGPEATVVDVAPVTRAETLQSFVTASGEVVATRYADIGSAVMGRLVSLAVAEGSRVTAGQVLARIDPVQASSTADAAAASLAALEADARGADSQVNAAEAELAVARARADEAGRALQRARELREASLLPQSEFDQATAAAEGADAQVASATATLARARQASQAAGRRVAQARAESLRARDQLAKTEITAPIDGVVTRLDVEEGEMVVIGVQNQPGTILMTVSDLSAVNAEVKVAEADVLRLRPGDTATVTLEALPERRFTGRVVEIGASALPQTGAQAAAREFRVKVRVEGDTEALRPGLTCDAEILVAERTGALTVPLQAVVRRPGGDGADRDGVFVVQDGVARFTPVTTGIIGGLQMEIDGLAEGTTVVAGPFQALRELADGTRVQAREAAAGQ
ncbi:MAG: efflux RND transporter periplasmic adaptor subunit [Vicinamibacterales bacterium]